PRTVEADYFQHIERLKGCYRLWSSTWSSTGQSECAGDSTVCAPQSFYTAPLTRLYHRYHFHVKPDCYDARENQDHSNDSHSALFSSEVSSVRKIVRLHMLKDKRLSIQWSAP